MFPDKLSWMNVATIFMSFFLRPFGVYGQHPSLLHSLGTVSSDSEAKTSYTCLCSFVFVLQKIVTAIIASDKALPFYFTSGTLMMVLLPG